MNNLLLKLKEKYTLGILTNTLLSVHAETSPSATGAYLQTKAVDGEEEYPIAGGLEPPSLTPPCMRLRTGRRINFIECR